MKQTETRYLNEYIQRKRAKTVLELEENSTRKGQNSYKFGVANGFRRLNKQKT